MSEDDRTIDEYPGYTIDKNGVVRLNGTIKPPRLDTHGYYAISLKNPNNNKHDLKRIKDLVAKAYLPNDDPHKNCLGVKDRDKKNHSLDNLIWRTKSEHVVYAASIPIDTSNTRMCKVCKKTLEITDFALDHLERHNGRGHRRHQCIFCIKTKKSAVIPTPEQKIKRTVQWRLSQYKLTPQQYDDMFKLQDKKCANKKCLVDISGKGHSNIDHCHITNKIRGILCPNCNKALGMVGDSSSKLQGLIEYLQPHSPVPQDVRMPVYGARVKPTKTGDQHGNSGITRNENTRALISKTKCEQAKKLLEATFDEKVKWWALNPNEEQQKKWRYAISRKYRENTLPQSCINILKKTNGWILSKGTPHTIDSQVQPS